jgi:hypothetical protein
MSVQSDRTYNVANLQHIMHTLYKTTSDIADVNLSHQTTVEILTVPTYHSNLRSLFIDIDDFTH